MSESQALTREQVEEQCLVEAAQCWCEPTTSHLPMQSEVSAVFARKLAALRERITTLEKMRDLLESASLNRAHEIVALREQVETLTGRLRFCAQVVIEQIGAHGPEDLEEALGRLTAKLAAMEQERDAAKKEAVKWQRIRQPTHGNCCTCQRCGQYYDDCRCDLDEICDEMEQLKQQLSTLQARLATVEGALQGILDIGKRDMTNVKYDGFFESARAALHGRLGEDGKT